MRLLIAEDDKALGLFLSRGLEADGHRIRLAYDGGVAVEAFREELPDLTILDLNMPVKDGEQVLEEVRAIDPDLPVLILTGRQEVETRVRCLDLGADDLMVKPFRLHELRARCRALLRRPRAALIEGPTGSGKELVAAAIHRLSERSRKPFVAINCAAIPEALLEAELFGHTRGAFTGAVQGRVGRIEAANGGTLFLDEIGEMPLALQAKLLRFVECGELQRVGDNETVKVDVRVVAATHRKLVQQASAGRFRSDLYYRLAVFLIRTVTQDTINRVH